jgi:superfamily II helicase
VFCPTKAQVVELATILDCLYYMGGDNMTEEEKNSAISQWLSKPSCLPAIVATSALGPGFDYLHVRLVVHVGEPELMTDFSQESGRAGRDEKKAESVILLRATWKPQPDAGLSADKKAMQLYLTQRYCFRGVLSQFLDQQQDWRWCMENEESCSVCREPYSQRRPDGLVFSQITPVDHSGRGTDYKDTIFQGPKEVLRQDRENEGLLIRYKRDLEITRDSCLYCRMLGRAFDHMAMACAWRWDWIRAKKKALVACKASGRSWMPKLVVCWKCY